MAYQNVGTPRFYVNVLEWLMENGAIDLSDYTDQLYRTLPVSPTQVGAWVSTADLNVKGMTPNGFIAILRHTMATDGNYHVIYKTAAFDHIPLYTDVVNYLYSSGGVSATYDGFTIATFNNGYDPITGFSFSAYPIVGSVIIGTYYDMPHSPELKLTMTREMDGVKRIRTKGGSDLVNHKYIKPPLWGVYAPWGLAGGGNQKLARAGRRTWNLSFNYLSDRDLFGANQYLGRLEWGGQKDIVDDEDYGYGEYYGYNVLTDDNFYSQVIHKTNGGQLPFVFQPDSNDNTNFAICKFDMNKFQFKQVANGVYNMKLKIREVW